MASLSIARPGKVSERQYLGDLAGLFDRHRRRSGVALTPESFASDLAANDSLRSGLFTLCTAISHMGERDLSPEELLDLVARSLGGAGSAEGEAGTQIPTSLRAAFLSGYEAWQNRDLQPASFLDEPEVWPPPSDARKPPARETGVEFRPEERAVAAAGTPEPLIAAAGRRTVQEALSLVRREQGIDPNQPDPHPSLTGIAGDALGSMTLGELKHFLEDIEHRVSRIGPHMHQLSSAAREPSRRDRTAPLSDSVIPFPTYRANSPDSKDDDAQGPNDKDPFRRRPIPVPNLRAEDAFLAQSAETDERPRGIDALVAAAPAWASATPTTRTFDEDAFLSRHSYLSPARRPGTLAPAPVYVETAVAPVTPPAATPLPAPTIQPVPVASVPPAPAHIVPPLIGLDAEDDPLLSPMERLESYMVHLSPRKVFSALAGLTILAGGLAGFIAYRTLHPSRVPEFKDLEQNAHLSAPPPVAPVVATTPVPAGPVHRATPAAALSAAKTHASGVSPIKPKPHLPNAHAASVAVWPPVPEQTAHDAPSTAPAPPSSAHPAIQQAASGEPLYVPAPTMIGYALASPQPAYPVAQAHGISGTVAVEVTISRLGDVISAHAVSGPQELRPAAVAAVRGWRFRPYAADGRPTEVTTTLQFFFRGE